MPDVCSNPPCQLAEPFRYCPIKGCTWMEAPEGKATCAHEQFERFDAILWCPRCGAIASARAAKDAREWREPVADASAGGGAL